MSRQPVQTLRGTTALAVAILTSLGFLLGAGLPLPSSAAAATDPVPADNLTWYQVELVLFLRNAPDPDSNEALDPADGRTPLAANTLALMPTVADWPAAWTLAGLLQGGNMVQPDIVWPLLPAGISPALLTEAPPAIDPELDPLTPGPLLPELSDANASQTAAKWAEPPPLPLTMAWQSLPAEAQQLNDAVRRLHRAREFSVVWHYAWLQPFPDNAPAQPLQILLENVGDAGDQQLFGDISIRLARYLHLDAHLRLGLPKGSGLVLLPPDATMTPASAVLQADPISTDPDLDWVAITEYRRMRSRELHYIDHPLLGILVRFEPIQ